MGKVEFSKDKCVNAIKEIFRKYSGLFIDSDDTEVSGANFIDDFCQIIQENDLQQDGCPYCGKNCPYVYALEEEACDDFLASLVKDKPLRGVWLVTYTHKHGTDITPCSSLNAANIACLEIVRDNRGDFVDGADESLKKLTDKELLDHWTEYTHEKEFIEVEYQNLCYRENL